MPIRPENVDKYPANWRKISMDCKNRAGWRCEFCDVAHGSYVVRELPRIVDVVGPDPLFEDEQAGIIDLDRDMVRVVLTTAHLDHDPTNNTPDNLRALCQKCHLRYDAEHHKETRIATLNRAVSRVQPSLLPVGDK